MQMIRHCENQTPLPFSSFFAEFNGLDQCRPDVLIGKLIRSSGEAVDGDKKGLLSRINPNRWIVWQMFPTEIHGFNGSAVSLRPQRMEREWEMPREAGTSCLGLFILHPFACGFSETALPRMEREWGMPREAGTSCLGLFILDPFACGFSETALPRMEREWVIPREAGTSCLGLFIRPAFACGFSETALPCF